MIFDTAAGIPRFRTKEDIQNELHAICDGQDPIYPSIPDTICNEAENKRSYNISALDPKVDRSKEIPIGTPTVIIRVQTPIYFALSLLKKVSATTALPMAAAGEIKNAVRALQVAMDAYVGLFAHPTLQTALSTSESRKIGRRPKRWDRGFQINGPPPRIAIWREVR